MAFDLLTHLSNELEVIQEKGLFKTERVITTPQQAIIQTQDHKPVINLCANNYLGLANHPQLLEAARKALSTYGYGLSSVRFICGTQTIHKELENTLSQFLKTEDTLLYSSCFDANTGLFETLLNEEDAILSDGLNHASIIDGIRLCKAKRFLYTNNDMNDLENKLKESLNARFRLIVTDGVFSMDGTFAQLNTICDLAKKYNAYVMVDDSHAVGFIGEEGTGTPEYWNVIDKVDIITGTLGKALGGASGGYTSGKKPIIDWLRQRSRPYLFSNTLAPVIAATSLTALELLKNNPGLKETLKSNTLFFRKEIQNLGFTIIPGEHPIVPIMIKDERLAATMASQLLKAGVYVIPFSYPVVPINKSRIRVQLSALHTEELLNKALSIFKTVGKQCGVLA